MVGTDLESARVPLPSTCKMFFAEAETEDRCWQIWKKKIYIWRKRNFKFESKNHVMVLHSYRKSVTMGLVWSLGEGGNRRTEQRNVNEINWYTSFPTLPETFQTHSRIRGYKLLFSPSLSPRAIRTFIAHVHYRTNPFLFLHRLG